MTLQFFYSMMFYSSVVTDTKHSEPLTLMFTSALATISCKLNYVQSMLLFLQPQSSFARVKGSFSSCFHRH